MVRGAIPKDNCHTYCHKKHQHLHLSANVFWLPNVKQNIWQRDFKDTNFLEVKQSNKMCDMIRLLLTQMTITKIWISLRIWFQLSRLIISSLPYEPKCWCIANSNVDKLANGQLLNFVQSSTWPRAFCCEQMWISLAGLDRNAIGKCWQIHVTAT